MKNCVNYLMFLGLAIVLSCQEVPGHADLGVLRQGFSSPPDSVRPGVYWYFMDGNRTREGMTKDLEAIKDAGIGSVIFLEVNVGVPQGKVDFLSDEWQDQFVYAVKEARRLGIEIILGTGPGWAGSGGPWVSGGQSMQHLVSSSLDVSGGSRQQLKLPLPPPRKPYFGEGALTPELKEKWMAYYKDVAVLAFPTPPDSARMDDVDEMALYYRSPYSSMPGVKPFLPDGLRGTEPPPTALIDTAKIINLTSAMHADGSLEWQVPAGKWTVMRFVSRNNGAVTRPAPMAGIGFEADKFYTTALNAHMDAYFGKLVQKLGPLANNDTAGGLKRLHIDSWEMGAQNWSPHFRDEFKKRRGYDPLPFFPVYAGRIVESREISGRFLWDLRLTSQELITENHAGHLKALAKRHGLKLSIEPYDMNPAGDLELGAVADVPMAEFWSMGYGFNSAFSCLEAASIAHVDGKPVVAAESFTAQNNEAWKQYPGVMKNQGDWAFATGVNQFMFHTFQHQSLPDNLKPGMTMGPYGVHWDRNQTWWHLSKAYHRYVARCSYLLQQGRTSADILYMTAEGGPNVFTPPASAMEGEPIIPDRKGYNFDGCSPAQLLTASVEGHDVVFPGGARYKLLVLPLVQTMTPQLLNKLKELVLAGAKVMGIPPLRSPGLSGYPQCDEEVKTLSKTIWGDTLLPAALQERELGKGKIWWGGEVGPGKKDGIFPAYEVARNYLAGENLPEDFHASRPIRYTHRISDEWDLYFVANKTDSVQEAVCDFRVTGSSPELWDPLTGLSRPLPEFTEGEGATGVSLRFEPYQSFFVVFPKGNGKKAAGRISGRNFPALQLTEVLKGAWQVSFDTTWGGPRKLVFDTLADWTSRPEDGIKHYSGSAFYTKEFNWDKPAESGEQVFLDLGKVEDMARVSLNGKDLGVLWTAPWRVNISQALNKGKNRLEVEVVNRWVNRLIGDQSKPGDGIKDGQWPDWLLKGEKRTSGRYTFSTFNPYTTDSPLLPSGLIGPVSILTEVK